MENNDSESAVVRICPYNRDIVCSCHPDDICIFCSYYTFRNEETTHTEARTSIYESKWRKRKMKQMKLEKAIAFAEYLCRYNFPADWSIYSIKEYLYNELKKRNNNGK